MIFIMQKKLFFEIIYNGKLLFLVWNANGSFRSCHTSLKSADRMQHSGGREGEGTISSYRVLAGRSHFHQVKIAPPISF